MDNITKNSWVNVCTKIANISLFVFPIIVDVLGFISLFTTAINTWIDEHLGTVSSIVIIVILNVVMLFNIFFVLGTTSLITPVAYADAFVIDNIIAFVIALFLLLLVINKKKALKRWGGAVLLGFYIIYFIYLMINPFGYGV